MKKPTIKMTPKAKATITIKKAAAKIPSTKKKTRYV